MFLSLPTNKPPFLGYTTTLVLLWIIFNVTGCNSMNSVQKDISRQQEPSSTNSETYNQENELSTETANSNEEKAPSSAAILESESDANVPEEPNIPLLSWADFYAQVRPGLPVELGASLEVENAENEEKNLYEGFRIQIYSGPSPSMADTVSKQFRTWSIQHITGYSPETYTFFKAPYYRVHVGDFHDRTRAYSVSQIIKRQFPDAWVVYYRVIPWNAPADSVLIRFQRN